VIALFGEFKTHLKPQDGFFKWRKILGDSCFDDCSGGVEIAVVEPVARTGAIRLLDIRLARDELRIQQLRCLANFNQTHPNGVENESVGEFASSGVAPDCGNRVNYVGEALLVTS
jgi:hypothetical protein